jgi:hypothetical protein
VTSVEEFFSDIYIPLDCECLAAEGSNDPGERNRIVSLTEVYHVHPNLPLQKNRIGNWSSGSGLAWTNVSFYQRRNFHGITLKAAKLFGVS